ncbi:MAG TPA: DJ-1/PfpI family protein [Candidatus Eremiobacteraceae bacterium]|nr:DJ-1/PfpI family protein [Candidatus Eremiobacteraceae bacterium]
MKRSELIAAAGVVGVAGLSMGAADKTLPLLGKPIKKPASGNVQVAVLISDLATVIDFAGPWETFQDAGYDTHVVSKTLDVVTATNGLKIVPEYTFETAPQPNVVVIGAQKAPPEALTWIRKVGPGADVVMSVCTGAFILARTGLLDGEYATTHHEYYDKFEKEFPKVHLVRGPRFVENEQTCCAGGLTSGIDLALRVVERYDGKAAADGLAFYMEHVRTARPA